MTNVVIPQAPDMECGSPASAFAAQALLPVLFRLPLCTFSFLLSALAQIRVHPRQSVATSVPFPKWHETGETLSHFPALPLCEISDGVRRDSLPWGIHPDPPVPQQAHPSLP